MISLALNHMTAPNASFQELLAIAQNCGCSSVELRNDLPKAAFHDEAGAKLAGRAAQSNGLEIAVLAELMAFNQFSEQTRIQATALASLARACGASGMVLIPANDSSNPDQTTRQSMLTKAFNELLPILDEYDLCAFVEPLGFESSTLRYKSEVVERIEAENLTARFKLVHDTFHHHLAEEKECFAGHTGMVHVSGVEDSTLKRSQMQDCHRGLVNEQDQLNNLDQLEKLISDGYKGPVSMEAFAPEVHALPDLTTPLRDSYQFINSGLATMVA